MPPPDAYQHNQDGLERRNQSLTIEVQQLKSNNRVRPSRTKKTIDETIFSNFFQNLQKQYEEILDRLQNSQNLTKQDLADIMKQSGLGSTFSFEYFPQSFIVVIFRSNERFGRI